MNAILTPQAYTFEYLELKHSKEIVLISWEFKLYIINLLRLEKWNQRS